MPSTSEKNTSTVNPAVDGGDHDRVAMLSVRADGTADQTRPEFIGDADATRAATEEQFRQQAVSAADVRLRGVEAPLGYEVSTTPDPTIAKIEKAHDAAAASAEKAAGAAVDKLTGPTTVEK